MEFATVKEHIYASEDLILCQTCSLHMMQVRGDFPHYCYPCKKKKKAEHAKILSWFKPKKAN